MYAKFAHCGKVLYMVLGRFTKPCIKFLSHITATVNILCQNFCGKQIFFFKVILFSGAKKFTLFDHKTRLQPAQHSRGEEAKKILGRVKYLSSFFSKFDDS